LCFRQNKKKNTQVCSLKFKMKHSEQYRSSGTRPNVTISDASIVYEHPDNEDTNGENEYRQSRLTQTIQNKNRRTNDINIQHISPIKSYSE
jgi:hypothetical protein